jgi:hypothetical protein
MVMMGYGFLVWVMMAMGWDFVWRLTAILGVSNTGYGHCDV